jgi:hypothetical protein
VVGGLFGQQDALITVHGRMVSIDGLCLPVRGRVKATRKGTRVIANWKTCGEQRRVRLRGRIDVACTRFTGTIAARGRGRTRIVAVLPPPPSPTTLPVTTTTPTTPAAPITSLPAVSTTVAATTSTTIAPGIECSEQSLRQAVAAGGSIVLGCGGVTIPITAVLEIAAGASVSIAVRGPGLVTLSGSGTTRLFTVNGTLELADLVVQSFAVVGALGDEGTAAADGIDGEDRPGAGPGADGLTGQDAIAAGTPVAGHAGAGARGGAILIDAGGLVRLTRVVFRRNSALGGDGGDGGFCNGPPDELGCGDAGSGGAGGAGGALPAGEAGTGGSGGDGGNGGAGARGSAGGPGGDGEGGAIYNAGTLEIADSTFDENEALGGFGGAGELGRDGGLGGAGGAGGDADETGGDGGAGGSGGSSGSGGQGALAGHGFGGAIHNAAGATLTVTRTMFSGNAAFGGDGGDGGDAGFCNDGGAGGAPGTARTDPAGDGLGGDGGQGGAGGDGGSTGNGGDAVGGAIYNAGALALDPSVTFTGNQVIGGLSAPEAPNCLGAGPCPGVRDTGCDGGVAGDGGIDGDVGADGVDGQTGVPAIASGPDVGPP